MNRDIPDLLPLSEQDLLRIFHQKNGRPDKLGWGPRMRLAFSYFNPDDRFETLVEKLVESDTHWLDVGCGRDLFPSNKPLARELADRCKRLLGVDPDDTLDQNPYVHDKAKVPIDDFVSDQGFDLITLRMVAEHIVDPEKAAKALVDALNPGGRIVIYTVNRFSPIPLLTGLIPFQLHHPVKRFLWNTERQDTFPTAFKMNTRRTLRKLFESFALAEEAFTYLDDCRTFGQFRITLFIELSIWWLLHKLGLRYPENCLLGVYRKPLAP